MELAVKFQIKAPDQISLDEIFDKNPLVDDFIAKSRWKPHIIRDTSVPSDANLGHISTHWWNQFLPSVVIRRLSDSKRSGGVKRGAQTDAEGSKDGEDGNTVSNPDKPPAQERRKRRKVSKEVPKEMSSQKETAAKGVTAQRELAKETVDQQTMLFNPVSRTVFCHSTLSDNPVEMFLLYIQGSVLHGNNH